MRPAGTRRAARRVPRRSSAPAPTAASAMASISWPIPWAGKTNPAGAACSSSSRRRARRGSAPGTRRRSSRGSGAGRRRRSRPRTARPAHRGPTRRAAGISEARGAGRDSGRDDPPVAHARHRPVDVPQVGAEEVAEPVEAGPVADEGMWPPTSYAKPLRRRVTQRPPTSSRASTRATRAPSRASRSAAPRPAGPAPRTRASRVVTLGTSAPAARRVNRRGTSVLRLAPWAGLYSAAVIGPPS